MTCEEFERVVTDLACEFLIEAAARKRALAHARACSRCAARLRQERALTAALNEAAGAETAQASTLMKTALLAAFRQQTDLAGLAAPPASASESSRRPPRWLMAAAAALLLLAILVALQVLHRQSRADSSAIPESTVAEKTPAKAITPQPSGDTGDRATAPDLTKKEGVQPSAQGDQKTPAPRLTRRRMRPVFRPEMAGTRDRSSETVTEFIPLTALADATAMNSGTIVRVEMPRASLLAMGLPLNAERAREIVKADIVVGDDGLARAIRLVY